MGDSQVDQKLAAILVANVAGYSALMGDDERATVATLDKYRTVFREHISEQGGRVVDTAGDSVLAVFPSAIGAVEAAIDIQDAHCATIVGGWEEPYAESGQNVPEAPFRRDFLRFRLATFARRPAPVLFPEGLDSCRAR